MVSQDSSESLEARACAPHPVVSQGFNDGVELPYGLTTEHIRLAMQEFIEFLGFVNEQFYSRDYPRLEALLMPANFSSLVGELMVATIPRYCSRIVKNRYHNGYPDLLPANLFPDDAVQHGDQGIEVKASRYLKGWQGHNPEEGWLLVFVFDSNRPSDAGKGQAPYPFRFVQVLGAHLTRDDWSFSGRTGASRRTITASVRASGYAKMAANLIYRVPDSK